MLVMIHEYLLGERSAWSAYFRVLPTRFDTLMFWSESELAELQASAVVDKIGKQGAEESILEMIAPIVRANPTLFPPVAGLPSYNGPDGERVLLELAHMMGSLIMAYAFDIEKPEDEEDDGEDGYVTDEEDELPKGMVPLADLLNADADRNNVCITMSHSSGAHYINIPFSSGPSFPRGRVPCHEGNQAHPSRGGDLQRLWADS